MTASYVLALDGKSSSARAVVVNLAAEVVAEARHPLVAQDVRGPGGDIGRAYGPHRGVRAVVVGVAPKTVGRVADSVPGVTVPEVRTGPD